MSVLSNVVPQLKLQGVRMQIVLLFEVGLIIFSDIVIDQCDGYDKRNEPLMVVINDLKEFLFFIAGELRLKIPHNVHEYVCILLDGRFETKGLHEELLVPMVEFFLWEFFWLGNEFSHHPVMLGTVREDQHLMFGVKIDQVAPTFSVCQDFSPSLEDKDAFDEILTEPGIMQATLIFDWKQWEMVHKNSGKNAHPPFRGDIVFVVDFDAFHATAG